jgi:hypothetical protein
MFSKLPQFKDSTEEEIFILASDYADKQIERREQAAHTKNKGRQQERDSDEDYRDKQERTYRRNYQWTTANDEASLDNLLNLEVQIRRISRELDQEDDPENKNKLRKSLSETTKEHRTLQEKLGIDRISRSKQAAAKSTVDDWERIKQEAKKKLDDLALEFSAKASQVTSEAELRDRMKYHFAIPFAMVDDVLSNHRRVLGLDTDVQKS